MAWLARKLTGEQIEPDRLNPYAELRPEPPKTPEELDRENDLAWKLLDRAWGGE